MTTVDVAELADLVDGEGRRFDVGGNGVALFRVGDSVHAIADRCSHAEASLAEGDVFDGEVECPRHGALFDITTGAAVSLPASKPVQVFPTTIVDGTVTISVPKEGDDE